jgi:hypothetical protein
MSDSERNTRLFELVDKGTDNNYAEYKIKNENRLKEWDLWPYVGGDRTEAPVIPELVEDIEVVSCMRSYALVSTSRGPSES